VLIFDETGFIKKGDASAGVARQYTGTSGKVDNCQVAVFAAYASRTGRALIDRELYLPKSWTGDEQRSSRAGVPETRRFATKPDTRPGAELAGGTPALVRPEPGVHGESGRRQYS